MQPDRLIAVATLVAVALAGCGTARPIGQAPSTGAYEALKRKKPPVVAPVADKDWVMLEGEVKKLLPDDLNGSKHQHFLVLVEGRTVKVAHNIDLAPKVPVKVGEPVEIKCEYIEAKPYDVAHWTHYDPAGGEGGWIKYRGKIYDRK